MNASQLKKAVLAGAKKAKYKGTKLQGYTPDFSIIIQ